MTEAGTPSCPAHVPLEDALALIRTEALPLDLETVPIADAGLRILGETLRARIDAPRGNVAAMDGFAIQDAAARAGRRTFDIAGTTYAGSERGTALEPDSAYRVMTGGLMPPVADRVIPFELVDERDGRIHIDARLPHSLHVRTQGSDFRAGDPLLGRGTLLDPARLLVAMASDQPTVAVHRRPRLRIVASGDELIPAGTARDIEAGVPDSISAALLLFARQWGAESLGAVTVGDDVAAIEDAARRAVADSDILVLAGGASNGDRDLARPALRAAGLQLGFSGVAIKPGKPAWFGRIGRTHVVGLPGNPAAALVVARLFLAPLIHAMGGRGFDTALQWREMPLSRPVPAAGPRETFLFARRDGNGVEVIERQSASTQLPLARAEMIVRRPPQASLLSPGALVPTLDLLR